MNNLAVGVLTFEQISGSPNRGSSKIRVHDLLKHWSDAEIFRIGKAYSTVIFQKSYWPEYAEIFQGVKILDLCDPDFLHWKSKCLTMINLCDAVTTSTQALADHVLSYVDKPVICIPDRVDISSLNEVKKCHLGNGETKTAVWYGYSDNYPALECAIPFLVECNIGELIVISDLTKPYWLPIEYYGSIRVTNIAWNPGSVNINLLKADIVVNFSLDYGRWRYKSNNKSLLAWALGLPVAHNPQELRLLLSENARIIESDRRYSEVKDKYDVSQSVEEYCALISDLRSKR